MVEVEESILNGYPLPISYDCSLTIMEQMKRDICKIKIGPEQGTGFFCKIPFPDRNNMLPVFITTHHILNEDILYKPNSKIAISIREDKKMKEIKLDNRKIYTNKEYDITIIEIKQEDGIKSFLELDDKILNDIIDKNNENDQYVDDTIYIIHYPESKLSVSYGTLEKIYIDKEYDFRHKCSTRGGSSGSPILNSNNKVIGIHKKGSNNKYNLGTFINYPIREFIGQENDNKIMMELYKMYKKGLLKIPWLNLNKNLEEKRENMNKNYAGLNINPINQINNKNQLYNQQYNENIPIYVNQNTINVIFQDNKFYFAPVTISNIKREEKISSIIEKYRKKSGDWNLNEAFLFNSQDLNKDNFRNLTCDKVGIKNGSTIYIFEPNFK